MGIIEVRGLSKSFGRLKVLEKVDLSVEAGERVAIIGGSGCGKSVLLRSLELLETPDAGQIFIDGQEITAKGANVDLIRRSMGMVYQRFHLFTHMDVMDNLCLAPVKLLRRSRAEAEEMAMDLLRQVGLSERAHAWPSVLSGGQQQRIAICRCLMMEPKVLLFDEPTSALDPTMVGEVLAVIRMLAKRSLTMLIVTHEMRFAREVADRVLFLADHGIYEQGTPEEIFDHPVREKTRAFIRKVKYFSFDITSRAFDLMAMQGGIQLFAEKYGIGPKGTYRLQICCEELIYQMLEHCYAPEEPVKLRLDLRYAEQDGETEILLRCDGRPYDPFSQDVSSEDADAAEYEELMEEDTLSVIILKKMSSRLEYRLENGINYIEIRL